MNQNDRRTVITGVGAVTPLGTGSGPFWENVAAGKSGVMAVQAFAPNEIVEVAAEVRDYDAKKFVEQRKSLKVMARDIQVAVGAAKLAIEDADPDLDSVERIRIGVSCGAALMASELDELGPPVSHSVNGSNKFDMQRWGSEGIEKLFPLWMLKYLPNMPACHISIIYDAQGPNNSITAGEASATLAIGEAHRILQRGTAEVMIAGGADSRLHPLSVVRLGLQRRLTRPVDDPATAVRPFDRERGGLVPGEGAGMLILETLERARDRGAKIYGEVIGFGSACVPKDPSRAVTLGIRRALEDAGLRPEELGHVRAFGAGCVDEDRREAKGLADVLGPAIETVPVVAYKGYLGFLAAACGAVELVLDLLAARHGVLPPTLNFRTPDPDLPPLRILAEKIPYPNQPFVSYDVSHSGQCAALVVRPAES